MQCECLYSLLRGKAHLQGRRAIGPLGGTFVGAMGASRLSEGGVHRQSSEPDPDQIYLPFFISALRWLIG